jgi:dihydroxyacetone kinase
MSARRLRSAALAAADALTAAETTLTDLDTKAGDGDLGSSMARGAAAARTLLAESWQSPAIALAAMGDALRRAIAGSSGPFYATALLRAARHLAHNDTPSPAAWAEAFMLAVQSISELGGAKPGDRTMLDALYPAAKALSDALADGHRPEGALAMCLAAAEEGAKATAAMQPRLGRASYLGERAVGIPDAGAVAVAVWLRGLVEEVSGSVRNPNRIVARA